MSLVSFKSYSASGH